MSHRSAPNRSTRDMSGGIPIYFNIYHVGTFPTCNGWWSKPPQSLRPNVVVSVAQNDVEAVKTGDSQFTFWGFEYICNTTHQVTTGPCGIDLDRCDGCVTIHWRAPLCKCSKCRLIKPYQRKSPGDILAENQSKIECQD